MTSGEPFEIKAACPDDARAVREFLEHLSDDTRWLRYHSPVPIVRSWMVDAVVGLDHDVREALLAIYEGRVIGVAEWGRVAPDADSAHVAIVVDDDFRRRGIAGELMRHLAAAGRAHGIEAFEASVLSVNRPTIGLVQKIAPERSTRFDGPVVEVVIPLQATA
jgi:ribosomal protein S18 acetylase RimI-like enzyme